MTRLRKLLFAIAILLVGAPGAFAQSTAQQMLPGYLTSAPCYPGYTVCYQGMNAQTPAVAGSSASSDILKAAPGDLMGVYVTAGATQGWLMVFNSATAPSNGSTTAGTASGNMEECIYVPSNTTQAISFQGLPVEHYSVGITAIFSSTGCATLTASATAFVHGLAQ